MYKSIISSCLVLAILISSQFLIGCSTPGIYAKRASAIKTEEGVDFYSESSKFSAEYEGAKYDSKASNIFEEIMKIIMLREVNRD